MSRVGDLAKKHWRKVAGVACFTGAALLAPIAPAGAAALGMLCGTTISKDPQVQRLGVGIAGVIAAVRGKKDKP